VATAYEDVLVAKRGEILTDIERLRSEASELAARLSVKEGQLRNIDDLLALERGQVGPSDESSPVEGDRRNASLSDQAVDVLRAAAKPTHYRQLLILLAERSIYVPGKDPGANLIAHIARDPRFVRTGRGVYALTEWPSVRPASGAGKRKRATSSKRRTKAHGADR
jgi:hypothetical protein